MLRSIVLCFAFTFVNSRIVLQRNFVERDPLDDWRHLEGNEIPTNADDGYKLIPSWLLLQRLREILKEDGEKQLSDTTVTVTSAPEDLSTPVPFVEETENSTLPDYTQDSDGYLIFPGIGRFKLYDEDYPWISARDQCISDGGDLAVPDSEEKVAVFMKMYDMYPEIPATAILRNQVYIGIQDPEDTREFVTVKGDPVSLDLPLWAKGEPDNEPPGREDCVTFRTDARIRDVPCYFYLPFFCEKPLYNVSSDAETS